MREAIARIRQLLVTVAAGAALSFTGSAQSVTTTITRSPGSVSQDATVTGVNGKTATYQETSTWGNGTYNDSRSVTGFGGKTAVSNTTGSYGPGNASRETVRTGFNGKATTYQNHATWGNGSFNDTKYFTGVNGGTGSVSTTRSGGIVTKTYTGRNGNSRTFDRVAGRRR